MKSLAGGEEDTVVAGPSVGGEGSSSGVGVNHMASESLPESGNVGYDTQVGKEARRMWA